MKFKALRIYKNKRACVCMCSSVPINAGKQVIKSYIVLYEFYANLILRHMMNISVSKKTVYLLPNTTTVKIKSETDRLYYVRLSSYSH